MAARNCVSRKRNRAHFILPEAEHINVYKPRNKMSRPTTRLSTWIHINTGYPSTQLKSSVLGHYFGWWLLRLWKLLAANFRNGISLLHVFCWDVPGSQGIRLFNNAAPFNDIRYNSLPSFSVLQQWDGNLSPGYAKSVSHALPSKVTPRSFMTAFLKGHNYEDSQKKDIFRTDN